MSVFYLLKWLQFVLLTILQPIFSLLGICTNLLSILCICNKHTRKNFQDPMYKHILVNASFNIFYCLIMSLKLINTCIFLNGSIFCSSLYTTNETQYFKIIVIFFLGNMLKFCCNLSYICFGLSRFILIADLKEKTLFKKFEEVKAKIWFLILLLISATLNMFTLFQYKLNVTWNSSLEFPYEYRNEIFCEDVKHYSTCRLFNGLKISINLLNDIVCFIIVILIDWCLLKYFNKNMEHKLHQNVSENHLIEIQKSKKNVNRMVVLNGLIYALSHLPEFVTRILLVCFAKKLSNFCSEKLSCDLANEEAQFFCLISIFSQFFIFLNFNKNFRSSFGDLKDVFVRKIKLKFFNVQERN